MLSYALPGQNPFVHPIAVALKMLRSACHIRWYQSWWVALGRRTVAPVTCHNQKMKTPKCSRTKAMISEP